MIIRVVEGTLRNTLDRSLPKAPQCFPPDFLFRLLIEREREREWKRGLTNETPGPIIPLEERQKRGARERDQIGGG